MGIQRDRERLQIFKRRIFQIHPSSLITRPLHLRHLPLCATNSLFVARLANLNSYQGWHRFYIGFNILRDTARWTNAYARCNRQVDTWIPKLAVFYVLRLSNLILTMQYTLRLKSGALVNDVLPTTQSWIVGFNVEFQRRWRRFTVKLIMIRKTLAATTPLLLEAVSD